jgi:hypothetical protein
MNKKILFFVSGIFLLAIGVALWVYYFNKPIDTTLTSQVKDISWLTYKNEFLGFQINYPKQMELWDGNCIVEDGQAKIINDLVPTKIFIDTAVVWISYQYSYENVNGVCKRIDNSIDLLKEQDAWKIVIADNINSDDDLNIFIKKFYKNFGNCQLGEKRPAKQSGVYDIITAYDGKDLGSSECFINSLSYMKYDPANKRVVAWTIGQEPYFWSDDRGTFTFDQDMVDSFMFLQ